MRAVPAALLFAALLMSCGPGRRTFEEPQELAGVEVPAAVLNHGEIAYMRYCRRCHGPTGEGNGPYAAGMTPPPADLTTGRYPRTSGESAAEELPTDAQLRRVITEGIEGTPMGPQPVEDADLGPVVQYLKTLSPRWRGQRVQ